MACDNCGFLVCNDIQSCVKRCKYARLCVGEELYNKLMKAYNIYNKEKKRQPSGCRSFYVSLTNVKFK
ncbi:MAG: hypothetical protein GX936_01810 [Clostridiales bacterium]|nr:hypothetical protein [Clostridiales bacterium]